MSSRAADEGFFHYRAQPGDTLIGLGQSMLTRPGDWPVLARINHIRNPRAIPVGTELRIPLGLIRSSTSQGTIVTHVGQATLVEDSGAPLTLAALSPVPVGSMISTGADGWVTVALADGSALRLAPASQARLERARHYESAGFFATTLSLIKGRLEALVTRVQGGGARFEVKTPQAQLGVRGTSFRVAADESRGETRSEVLTGAVAVATSATTQNDAPLVGAGFGTRVRAGAGTLTVVPLLPAPDLAQLPTLHERPLVRISLPAMPGAVAWRGEVAADADFRQVLAQAVSAAGGSELRFVGLPDGQHRLRVRAIDAQSLEGRDATSTLQLKARPEPPILSSPAPRSKLRATQVTLSWAQQEAAARYHLQLTATGSFEPGATALAFDDVQVTGSSRTLLLPPGDYTWRMASIRPDGDRGPWGDPQSFTLRPPPPQAPPPVISATHLQFAWAGEPGQRFEFQVAKDRSFDPPLSTLPLTEPTVQIDKPPTGGTLFIRYRAVDADGFVGPYTAAQRIDLPLCAQDRSGRCVQTRTGGALESR